MARRVEPAVARRGTFLQTFRGREDYPPPELTEFCARMERLQDAQQAVTPDLVRPGVIVYTLMPAWGRQSGHTWQVYLVQEEIVG